MGKDKKPQLYIASCSFGKDSIATILLALENNEPLDRVVFAEVMFDHERGISGEIPEHIEWIYSTAIPKLESMGVKVDVVKANKDYIHLCHSIVKKGKNAGKKYGVQNSFPCFANSELKISPIRTYYKQFKDYDIVEYVGIAVDEPKRLARLISKGGRNKVSLLSKYGYTEDMAKQKCLEYELLSPIYRGGQRGGCWFCYNAEYGRYKNIKEQYPEYWDALQKLYYATNSRFFRYDKTIEYVNERIDSINAQGKLFD